MTTDPARVSGSLVSIQREELRKLAGDDRFAAGLATIADDQREEYLTATATSWVRISTSEAVYVALAARLDRDVAALHAELVRLSVERNLRTLWRVFLRFTSDDFLVSRTPSLFAKGYDRGKLTVASLGRGHATLTLSEWDDPPDFVLRGTCGAVAAVLTVAGRGEAFVTPQRVPGGATFSARWRA